MSQPRHSTDGRTVQTVAIGHRGSGHFLQMAFVFSSPWWGRLNARREQSRVKHAATRLRETPVTLEGCDSADDPHLVRLLHVAIEVSGVSCLLFSHRLPSLGPGSEAIGWEGGSTFASCDTDPPTRKGPGHRTLSYSQRLEIEQCTARICRLAVLHMAESRKDTSDVQLLPFLAKEAACRSSQHSASGSQSRLAQNGAPVPPHHPFRIFEGPFEACHGAG